MDALTRERRGTISIMVSPCWPNNGRKRITAAMLSNTPKTVVRIDRFFFAFILHNRDQLFAGQQVVDGYGKQLGNCFQGVDTRGAAAGLPFGDRRAGNEKLFCQLFLRPVAIPAQFL